MSAVRDKLKPFAHADDVRAGAELVLALFGTMASLVITYTALTNGWWALYAFGCALGGLFLVKVFTIQHDCGHESMFSSSAFNTWVGRLCALVTTMPFFAWKTEHNIHHAQVGDIDRVGAGDVYKMTVSDYKKKPHLFRRGYHVLRNVLFFLFVAPFFYFFVLTKVYNVWHKEYALSTIATNLAVLGIFGVSVWLFGFWNVIFTYAPSLYLGGIIGLALFYLQHDYPEAKWLPTATWSHEAGALGASSLIVLPQPLEWFSHAIGYHHIHHLHTKVPGYRLHEAFDAVPELQKATPLTWKDVFASFNLKLWSFDANRLVTFEEAQKLER